MKRSSKRWRIDFLGTGAEDVAFDATFAQLTTISGAQVINETSVRLFVFSTDEQLDELLKLLKQRDFSIVTVEPEECRDWVKDVQDSWVPFHVGSFEILPVLGSPPSTTPVTENQILIRPGYAFGTGHSKTTQTALLNLDALGTLPTQPRKVLDVGTGSGILAIAVAKLFQGASIQAIDIDDTVLENAIGNVKLNCLTGRIFLSLNEIRTFQEPFDLIMANVEIGVHLDLFGQFNRLSGPGSRLLVAGLRDSITAAQYQRLLESNCANQHEPAGKWGLTHSIEDIEWKSFIFTKSG